MHSSFFEPLESRRLLHGGHDHGGGEISEESTPVITAPVVPAATGSEFQWTNRADSPILRAEASGAVVDGKIYLFGGFFNTAVEATARVDIYDPAANTWSQGEDIPVAHTHSSTAVHGKTIYVAGLLAGNAAGSASTDVWKYNTVTDNWSRGPSLPERRGAGVMVRVGKFLHYIAGTAPGRVDADDHWRLNLDGGTEWEERASLPNGRNHLGAAAIDGKIYAIGGLHDNDESDAVADVHIYNPATDKWKQGESLPRALHHIAAGTVAHRGRILVFGGQHGDGSLSNKVLAYDPKKDSWTRMPDLPRSRKSAVVVHIAKEFFVLTGNTPGPNDDVFSGVFRNTWSSETKLPEALGEVSAGIIDGKMYVVGNGDDDTFVYDLANRTWSRAAARQFPGDHHAAEVFNGKLYLIGGSGDSAGKVQVYDPAQNDWSSGRSMPDGFESTSSSSALIKGKIYVAGGLVDGATTRKHARYNPATDRWKMLKSMPTGVNHAASSTNGKRFFIFGGRTGGPGVSNGVDLVQIYNPATDTWNAKRTKLPQARGGMGKAVFHQGEFYIFGGETLNGPGATDDNVYNRVDIWDREANTWRRGKNMLTARHGIFPVEIAGRIYIAGGGTEAGFSLSDLLEIYNAV